MNRKILFTLLAGVSAAAALLVGIMAFHWYQDNRKPNFTEEYVIYIYPETTSSVVCDSLRRNGIVINEKSLARAFSRENVSDAILPGRYVVEPSATSVYLARMITRGWQTPQNLTLSGTIRSREKLATQISSQMMIGYDEVLAALSDEQFLSGYGTDTVQLFGFFIPDTYQIWWTSSIDEIFGRFRKEYDAFWTEERVNKARAQGLSPQQASTMASIVAGETRAQQEFSKIAGVYLNRLHKGMKLQADPTICYCYGYTLNRVLRKHLEIDSPYNTYKYAGLPPGPINVPGKAYIDAVLNPDRHGYIFFCANSSFDGTHKFAVTYSEHLKNAHDFQVALNARNKARGN